MNLKLQSWTLTWTNFLDPTQPEPDERPDLTRPKIKMKLWTVTPYRLRGKILVRVCTTFQLLQIEKHASVCANLTINLTVNN